MINIDNEFKSLIPSLTIEEYEQLEQNIINEGCRDALVTWNDTIIDGHNRYEICTKNNIPFKTVTKEFENREEVIEWIIRNQFGRRNLPNYERGKLALKLESVIREKAKENQGVRNDLNILQNSARSKIKAIDTRLEVSKIAGVSHDTIDRIKVIEREATPEQKEELSKGIKTINKVFNEIRPKKLKVIETVEEEIIEGTKICTSCGITKSKSEFYTDKNRCKECQNSLRNNKDFRGNTIKIDKNISQEITNRCIEELSVDKSKVVMTVEDLVDDLESFSSSFIRNLNRCTGEYGINATQEENKKIISILSEVKNTINKFRGVFVYE